MRLRWSPLPLCAFKFWMLTLIAAFPPGTAPDLLTWHIFKGSHVALPPIMALTLHVRGLNIFIPNILVLGDWGKSPKVGPIVRQTLARTPSITWFQQTLCTQRAVMVFRVPWNPFQFRAFIQQSLKILGMYIAYTCGSRAFPQKDPVSPSLCTGFVLLT